MANWPASLPQFSGDDYGEQDADNVLRSPTDVGPPKARRVSTAGPRIVTGSLDLTDAQVVTLQNFFKNDLLEGSLAFTRTNVHGASKSCRFLAPPRYNYAGFDWWSAAIQIEER